MRERWCGKGDGGGKSAVYGRNGGSDRYKKVRGGIKGGKKYEEVRGFDHARAEG